MADAIRALRPRYVIIENVAGLATKMGSRPGESALGTVVADLAEAGYVGSWIRLRASEVGAPHKRERVFVIAADSECLRVDTDAGVRRGSTEESGRPTQAPLSARSEVARAEDAVADSTTVANTGGERLDGSRGTDAERTSGDGKDGGSSAEGYRAPAPDSDGGGFASVGVAESSGVEGARGDVSDGRNREEGEWGAYAPAIERWTEILGRESPRPTDDRGRLNPGFVEWMLGFPPGWTEGENRTQRLRMLGNAVQVQCGEVIGRMLREERF